MMRLGAILVLLLSNEASCSAASASTPGTAGRLMNLLPDYNAGLRVRGGASMTTAITDDYVEAPSTRDHFSHLPSIKVSLQSDHEEELQSYNVWCTIRKGDDHGSAFVSSTPFMCAL